jgi:hypothetical protein
LPPLGWLLDLPEALWLDQTVQLIAVQSTTPSQSTSAKI